VISFDSSRVARQFRVVFCLCLAAERTMGPDSFARKRWNIVAEKRFIVLMAGSGGTVTEWVSFSDRGFPPGLWHLSIPMGDLEQPAANLRLFLNKDIESFRRLLSATSGGLRDRLLAHNFVRRQIRAAFIQGFVSSVMACPEDELPVEGESAAGNCWEVAFGLCRQIFPELWNSDERIESIKSVRRIYGDTPNVVETRVQAFAELPAVLERSQVLNPPGAA
jgi:hypothetical protein